jgi:hypothetical protein
LLACHRAAGAGRSARSGVLACWARCRGRGGSCRARPFAGDAIKRLAIEASAAAGSESVVCMFTTAMPDGTPTVMERCRSDRRAAAGWPAVARERADHHRRQASTPPTPLRHPPRDCRRTCFDNRGETLVKVPDLNRQQTRAPSREPDHRARHDPHSGLRRDAAPALASLIHRWIGGRWPSPPITPHRSPPFDAPTIGSARRSSRHSPRRPSYPADERVDA